MASGFQCFSWMPLSLRSVWMPFALDSAQPNA
jgi:hypothetical protein